MTPATAAATIVCAMSCPLSVDLSTSLISKVAAPRIAGTASMRLNWTAQLRRKPKARAIATVSPLRLTPGNGAKA